MRFTYLVLIAGLTFACGKIDKQNIVSGPIPGSENGNPLPVAPAVAASLSFMDAAQLPDCAAATDGQLVYLRKEATFATCIVPNWTRIDIGTPGASSSAGIKSTVYCSTTMSKEDLTTQAGLDSVPEGGINFDYSITEFANKSLYVQSRISSAASGHASGIFWSEKQGGFKTAISDSIVFDVHGAQDFGFFYFTNDKTMTGDEKNPYAIVYSDPALKDATVIIFDSAKDCITNIY